MIHDRNVRFDPNNVGAMRRKLLINHESSHSRAPASALALGHDPMKTVKLPTVAALALLTAPLIGPAQAADPPQTSYPPSPPYYAPPVLNWTGFYVGYNIGAAWNAQNVSSNFGSTWSMTKIAFIGGGQAGYNYQIGKFVIGVEADLDWTSGGTSTPFLATALGPLQAAGGLNWTSSAALRLGFAANCALFYGKLGYGWSMESFAINSPAGFTAAFASSTNGGGLIGAGLEYAMTETWTAKIEYDYVALANRTFVVAFPNTVTFSPNVQMLKVGFNYKMW
jgi:outer membrane immunogenic protein